MEAKERLYITADKKRLVAEGDPAGAFLYAAPGDTVPESAAAMFGLVEGRLAAEEKRGGKGEDKSRKGGSDKDRKGGGDKNTREGSSGTAREAPSTGSGTSTEMSSVGTQSGSPHTDDLTRIHGIGAKTAKALAAAGIDSFAKLAAVDPATPDPVADINPRAPWSDWIAAAKALAGPVEPVAGGLTINELPKE